MKILIIGHEQNLNGATRSLLNIADSMLSRGHCVYVLTAYHEGDFFRELKKRNVTVLSESFYKWCEGKRGRRGWIRKLLLWRLRWNRVNRKTAKKVAAYAIREKIDIIHSNTSVINIGGLISRYSGIRHVWHIREFADLDYHMFPLISKSRYYSFMNRYTDRFICVSNAVAEHYSLLDGKKKTVIYNGIDPNAIAVREKRREEEQVRILISGTVTPAKGQDEAVQACAELFSQGIDRFELLIAGAGKFYFDIPEAIKDRVKLLGYVDQIGLLLGTVDIQLVCSRAEAFGRVTAEAMMAGIPVIGSNTGGTPELIQDGVTGFLFEKGNSRELAEKIKLLMEDDDRRERMGKAAREYARRHFTIERCADEIEGLYKSLMTGDSIEAKRKQLTK